MSVHRRVFRWLDDRTIEFECGHRYKFAESGARESIGEFERTFLLCVQCPTPRPEQEKDRAVALEREACAKLVEQSTERLDEEEWLEKYRKKISAAIRARGK